MDLVTVATFDTVEEAYLAKSCLTTEGRQNCKSPRTPQTERGTFCGKSIERNSNDRPSIVNEANVHGRNPNGIARRIRDRAQ
jgi:hypothetical protein